MNIHPNILSEICDDGQKALWYLSLGAGSVYALQREEGSFLLLTPHEECAIEMMLQFNVRDAKVGKTNITGSHALAKQFKLDGFQIWTPEFESTIAFVPYDDVVKE